MCWQVKQQCSVPARSASCSGHCFCPLCCPTNSISVLFSWWGRLDNTRWKLVWTVKLLRNWRKDRKGVCISAHGACSSPCTSLRFSSLPCNSHPPLMCLSPSPYFLVSLLSEDHYISSCPKGIQRKCAVSLILAVCSAAIDWLVVLNW